MYRHAHLFQGVHESLQAVRQSDGRGGVGQKESAGNQHENPSHHHQRPGQASGGDGKHPELHQHLPVLGKEQVQHTGENQNHHQGLHAPQDGFERNGGQPDDNRQKQEHQAVGDPALRQEQGNDVHHQHGQLGSGIQPVNHGLTREILTQGNILKHGSSLPSSGQSPPPPAP